MLSECAISADKLGKCYHIYKNPRDRLIQTLTRNKIKLCHDFWALKDISFNIKRGESLGIIGRNGSGKSTLLQMLCGTLTPTTGHFNVKGKVAALLELGAGFNPEFTGRENVYLCATLYRLTKTEIDSRFEKIIQFADIGDFIDRPVKTYSSGMYVRLAFAIIAHIDADILIIDEALSVGDAIFSQKCMRFLHHFRENQGTLVFVSHDIGAVISLCSHAIWLNQGHLLMEGLPKDVADAYLAFSYEQQQGASNEHFRRKIDTDGKSIQIKSESVFDPAAESFGNGGALIRDVWLEDESGKRVKHFSGNEVISLHMVAESRSLIDQPIVGFQVKNHLGQIIFGQNTLLTYKANHIIFNANESIHAVFSFVMPVMQKGVYTVSVAIANGTQENHIQLHWIHDALVFEMHPMTGHYVVGLIDVPMQNIVLHSNSTVLSS